MPNGSIREPFIYLKKYLVSVRFLQGSLAGRVHFSNVLHLFFVWQVVPRSRQSRDQGLKENLALPASLLAFGELLVNSWGALANKTLPALGLVLDRKSRDASQMWIRNWELSLWIQVPRIIMGDKHFCVWIMQLESLSWSVLWSNFVKVKQLWDIT